MRFFIDSLSTNRDTPGDFPRPIMMESTKGVTMQPMRTGGHSAATDRIDEKIKRIDVLIVISSIKAAELIQALFRQLGFQNIHMAKDAVDAVALMRQLRMHLIIADSELRVSPASGDVHPNHPNAIELSGIHFVQRLRQSPNSPPLLCPC